MMRTQRQQRKCRCLMAAMVGVILVAVGGCAGEPIKPAPTVTPDQVHSNADKAFEKLKQDERNRTMSPGSPY